MDKSPEAFRTISEVAEALETPAHVLRFWESRFPQIRPVKRAGGRRYYRPADVALLTGIKRLLHDEGMTIRGVQKILREQGIRHVAGLPDDSSPEEEALEAAMAGRFDAEPALPADVVEDETAAALSAALDAAPEARVVPFAPVSPPVSPPVLPPASPAAQEDDAEAAPDPEAPPQGTLDWLASLPPDKPSAPVPDTSETAATVRPHGDFFDFVSPLRPADPVDVAPDDTPPEEASPEEASPQEASPADPDPKDAPPVEHRARAQPASPQPDSDSPDSAPEMTATLAARLRALPRGGMAGRQEALAGIAARIAALRNRLGGLPPRV